MTKPELRFMPMHDFSSVFLLLLPWQLDAYYVGRWYPPCNYDCLDCAYGSCRIRLSGGVFHGSVFSGGIDRFYGSLGEAFQAVDEAVAQSAVPQVVRLQAILVDSSLF